MKDVYLLILTSYDGIEKLCELTTSRKTAVGLKSRWMRAYKARLRRDIQRNPEDDFWKGLLVDAEKKRDFLCVQKWDGRSWKCVCSDLRVPPSKRMFR